MIKETHLHNPDPEIDPLFLPFFAKQGYVLLDGALATELEKRGADLNDPLWSARLLIENPGLIKQVHLDYLEAGADIITTASYQASFSGFEQKGFSEVQSAGLMQLSVQLAIDAVNEYCQSHPHKGKPLVAASVGPYGASLADGSEYRGDYGLTVEELMDFHRPRMKVLAKSGAGLLACETIPCIAEAEAIVQLLTEFPDAKAWISFSCRNGTETCHGEAFRDCAILAERSSQVIAVGVNCTSPEFVSSLISSAVTALRKPIAVYPNSGEKYDARKKCWLPGTGELADFSTAAINWYTAGATIIGGCCRTSPADIRKTGEALLKETAKNNYFNAGKA